MCCYLQLIGGKEKFLGTYLEVKQLWFIVTYGRSQIGKEKLRSQVTNVIFLLKKKKKVPKQKAPSQNLLLTKIYSPPSPSLQKQTPTICSFCDATEEAA